ncbi:formimidoylglutamase [Halococcus thailandensis]|uniref:Formimidoylglutamase n=1 Tax=Halococcus thailandensis JCM 13552 TaxID=1227457 RepID=M0N1T5_9EURY|nr:formimidoylglutamase [Halococcus thailandensis]EMA51836.1 formimidoylglutamase [Halococcus thailandensis JCM 13552]
MSLREPPAWDGPSSDPNDEQFGDIVEPATLDDASEFDAILVGEPYDGAVIGRRGAREGPGALREALAGVKTHRFDAGPVQSIGDLGDVEVPDGDVETVQESIRETTHDIHASDALPVFLGGDNSLTYPNAAPLLAESLGVVNFDAHLDCREVRGEPTSGTPYRQLYETGLDAYACVGACHFETSTAYAEYVGEQGGEIVTSEAVGDDPESAVERALDAMAGVETIYVSVDLDVLDAAAAPGVSAPTPGGITTRELFRMLRATAGDDRVAGFEIVECAPPLDSRELTAAAGARAIAHLLSGYNRDSP